jgi:Fic family protein
MLSETGRAELDRDGKGWPAVGSEVRPWQPALPPELVSRRVRERHVGPYRAAVVSLIAERAPHLPAHVSALAEDAAVEIGRFDAELGGEVAPFASVLLRSESATSSMIEQLTASARAIALAELGDPGRRNAAEIVGNVHAMRAAIDLSDRLDADAILAMHKALVERHNPSIAGRWRQEQVWVGGDSYGPHGAIFVPPHHVHVPSLIDDLVDFARRTDVPLLSQVAIAHAQFETIHPFPDGNGRTGRAIVHAMLRGHGLTRNVTVPVSAGLVANVRGYFDALTAYRDGDLAPIVESVAHASYAAIINGRQLVEELRELRLGWMDSIAARKGAAAWRLADLLIRQPVVDAASVAAELGIARQNAQRAIAPLVRAGVLREFTGFRRNRMWQSDEVLVALDGFAARAGQRGQLDQDPTRAS